MGHSAANTYTGKWQCLRVVGSRVSVPTVKHAAQHLQKSFPGQQSYQAWVQWTPLPRQPDMVESAPASAGRAGKQGNVRNIFGSFDFCLFVCFIVVKYT